MGNQRWNWDGLKTYLSKTYTNPEAGDSVVKSLGIDGWSAKNAGANGPLQTSFSGDAVHPIRQAWADTFKSNGQYMGEDPFLSNSGAGAFSNLANIDPVTKERSYSASAYYTPIKDRNNLLVVTSAYVEKILWSKDTATGVAEASGVQYTHEGKTCIANASCEVILAAGVFQSPKLLELSGIGNADVLGQNGIKVVENLPGVVRSLGL